MPRRARMYMPGLPYHVVQHGNNREACFIEPDDYLHSLELWKETTRRYGLAVHAYCLMTNHVHFLASPAKKNSLSKVMKVTGSRYAQYVNRKYQRTGTLWEGRHRSSLIQSDCYFLICSRYIELNPVRANIVKSPEEYRWSSYAVNAWGDVSWLESHEEYLELGSASEARCQAYRALFKYQLSEENLHLIRKAVHYCQPIGDDRFKQQIEEKYGIKSGQMKHGRPRRKTDELVKI